MKIQEAKESQDSNVPVEYGTSKAVVDHMRELAESIPSGEPIIKMLEKKQGFDVDEEEHTELLGVTINAIQAYFAQWDVSGGDITLVKYPLGGEQPEDTEERGELSVTWRGEEYIFNLSPTGYRSFAKFYTKWTQRHAEIIGGLVHIRSRLIKTKSGYLVNIPKFVLVQPGNMDQDTVNAEVEPDDGIPF